MTIQLSGAELIAHERRRQIEQEKWTPEHDDGHKDGSLALAAICYATPARIFVIKETGKGVAFNDPWPNSWLPSFDKRFKYGEAKETITGYAPDPTTYSFEERFDLLVKAGALIAAELDRLQRLRAKNAMPLSSSPRSTHGNPPAQIPGSGRQQGGAPTSRSPGS